MNAKSRKSRARRKSPPIQELLASRPLRNHAAEVLADTPERLVVSIPVKNHWWNTGLMRWIIPTRRYRQFELDRRGRYFLQLADGENTVAGIVRSFATEYGLSELEARVAVASFIETLLQKGLIVLVGPPAQSPGKTGTS